MYLVSGALCWDELRALINELRAPPHCSSLELHYSQFCSEKNYINMHVYMNLRNVSLPRFIFLHLNVLSLGAATSAFAAQSPKEICYTA